MEIDRIALGRRAVGCGRWRWMPGMRYLASIVPEWDRDPGEADEREGRRVAPGDARLVVEPAPPMPDVL